MTAVRKIELVRFDPDSSAEVDELKRQRVVRGLALRLLGRSVEGQLNLFDGSAALWLGLAERRDLARPGTQGSQGAFAASSHL